MALNNCLFSSTLEIPAEFSISFAQAQNEYFKIIVLLSLKHLLKKIFILLQLQVITYAKHK